MALLHEEVFVIKVFDALSTAYWCVPLLLLLLLIKY